MIAFLFPSACRGDTRLEGVGRPCHALEMILDWIWGLLEHGVMIDGSDLAVRSGRLLVTCVLCLGMNIFFCPYPLPYQRKMGY